MQTMPTWYMKWLKEIFNLVPGRYNQAEYKKTLGRGEKGQAVVEPVSVRSFRKYLLGLQMCFQSDHYARMIASVDITVVLATFRAKKGQKIQLFAV